MGCGSFLFTDKHFNMKQKIKEALKQQYGTRANKELGQLQLGLSEEVFERVAASVETFITDESAIDAFVKSESTLNLLKSYQSVADKARAEARNEPPKPSDDGNQPPKPNPEPPKPADEKPDFKAMFAEALAEAINPLKDELASLKAERAKETAVAALDKFVDGWDYAKGFPSESELAKRIALKVYKAGGETMTGEQLIAAFREEFDPAVKAKGVTDFTKPFDSDGGGGEDDADFSSFDRASQKLGWTEPKK